MMMPSPNVSNCGRPARPIICITSWKLNSSQPPFSGLYICVPLMITVCAGRFTPHASVAVLTSTCTCPSAKSSSTSVRSARLIPAWWMANPYGSTSRRSAERHCSASDTRISRLALSSRRNLASWSFCSAVSRIAFAVFAVSFRLCTKMMVCDFPAFSITFS